MVEVISIPTLHCVKFQPQALPNPPRLYSP